MATFEYKKTGLSLNKITIRRSVIHEGIEEDTVRALWADGTPKFLIAAMMGTHPLEVHRILGENPRPPSSSRLFDGQGDPDQPALL